MKRLPLSLVGLLSYALTIALAHAQAYVGVAPIEIDSDLNVSCTYAAASRAGCVQALGTQEFGVFPYWMSGFAAMGDTYFNGSILAYPNKQLLILGDRLPDDQAAAVVLGNTVWRDAGVAIEMRVGPNHDSSVLEITNEKTINIACTNIHNIFECSIVDATAVSSHITVTTMPRYNVTIQGKLSENHRGQLTDGGTCTVGVNGGVVEVDGGCYYPFMAPHGELAVRASSHRTGGGWLLEADNVDTEAEDTLADKVWFVDIWGGTGTLNCVNLADFPPCPGVTFKTTEGQQAYHLGAWVSTRLWACDEQRDYSCATSGWYPTSLRPDGGS